MENPKSTAQIAGHPIHPMLVTIPIACFVGALLTDLAYWRTAEMMWANFSAWLLTVGVIVGILAAIAGFIDFLWGRYAIRRCIGAGLVRPPAQELRSVPEAVAVDVVEASLDH